MTKLSLTCKSSTTPVFGAMVCIAALAATQCAWPRDTISEKNLQELRQLTVDACVDRQKKDSFNSLLKPGFIVQVCECFADQSDKRYLSSMDFQVAMAKHDFAAAADAMKVVLPPQAATQLLYACMELRGGINKGVDRTSPRPPLSEHKGIGADSRKSMAAGCTESLRRQLNDATPNEAHLVAYCGCFTNSIANEISEAEFAAYMQGDVSATTKIENLSRTATKHCMEMAQ